jgi:arylsulfatase A-like enzyme
MTVLLAAIALASCSQSNPKEQGESEKPKGRASGPSARKPTSRPKSLRTGKYAVRTLIKEAVRAEMWRDGLFIDMGTRDEHKFTLGGYGSGWKESRTSGETTHTEAAITSNLRVDLAWPGVEKIVIRARSPVKGQVLSLKVDGKKVGGRKTSTDWEAHTFELPAPLSKGRHDLSLKLLRRAQKKGGPAVQVDWIWLATAKGTTDSPPKPTKVATIDLERPRRALVGTNGRRYSFYLVVPHDGVLVFDYGADQKTTFRVDVTADGSPEGKTPALATETVFERTERAQSWKEAQADLSKWAGKLVRLDLVTAPAAEGSAGKAGWGEPEIMRPGDGPEVPVVTPAARAKNLIVIVVDTVRKDVYEPFVQKSRVKAPVMKGLAKESVWFDAAYANAPWTKPSTATILSGLYPATHKAEGFRSVLPKEVTLLSEHLQERGFETGAFVGNAFISDDFGFNKGWSYFSNYAREDKPTEAVRLFKDALAWVKKRDPQKRFFLYMQTMDPHVPYAVPESYLKRYYPGSYEGRLGEAFTGKETKDFNAGRIQLTEEEKKYVRALYDAEVAYHDHYLGELIKGLRESGVLEDTLLVITNDHGEELFERGELGHGHSLYDEQIAAPLLMRYPKLLPKGRRVDVPVGLVDLPATFCELLSVDQMEGMEGQSMRPVIFDRLPQEATYAVYDLTEHPRSVRLGRKGIGVRLGDYKLIVGAKKTNLFDIKNDPAERDDLAESHSIAHRGCEVYLGEGIAIPSKFHRLTGVVQKKKFEPGKAKIDPKLRRQLQALAYTN